MHHRNPPGPGKPESPGRSSRPHSRRLRSGPAEGSVADRPRGGGRGLQLVIIWSRLHRRGHSTGGIGGYRRYGSLRPGPIHCRLRVLPESSAEMLLCDIDYTDSGRTLLGALRRVEVILEPGLQSPSRGRPMSRADTDVAIVGMACVFPGARPRHILAEHRRQVDSNRRSTGRLVRRACLGTETAVDSDQIYTPARWLPR